MKLALVTTSPSVRSGIGDYTRHLLPYLRKRCEVHVFVGAGADDAGWKDERARLVSQLVPREFDQILYQLGNEQSHAFMPRLIRAIGGTVMQHDWILFDMALAAYPALARGGAKGHALAMREGGLAEFQVYAQNWLDRRRARKKPTPRVDVRGIEGNLLSGWHAIEPDGRWTADHATFRVPAMGVRGVRVEMQVEPGRRVRLLGGAALVPQSDGCCFVELDGADRPILSLEVDGVRVTKQQRRHGDVRRLGVFVTHIAYEGDGGSGEIDLTQSPALPLVSVGLSRDRFQLSLNRSVVRFADAFIVHSHYISERIERERNDRARIGILHHGAEPRWRDGDRRAARSKLGLTGAWLDAFLIVSFGGVQPHKRIDEAVEALALTRAQGVDARLILAGTLHSGEFDPRTRVKRLGLEAAVIFTGFVPEATGWDWLDACDAALNLRGPTSGGTSGGIFHAFSMGRFVIATDAAEQQELPDACVVKVPLGSSEVGVLARTFGELACNPARRSKLESSVRRFVEAECHWDVVAQQYHDYLSLFPAPRGARKRIISLVARDR